MPYDPQDDKDKEIDEQLLGLLERARLECMSLLDSARFSTWRDLHLRGELTAVTILARPDLERPEACRIDVICQGAGHLHADWERVPLELVDTETNQVLVREVLDARGRWSFSLNSAPLEQSLRFRNPILTLKLPAMALAALGGPPPMLPPREEESELFSATWKIHIVGKKHKKRVLRISVRALDPSLFGGAVWIEVLTRSTGRVLYSGTLELADDNGETGVLEIREVLLEISGDEDLKIEVRPVTGGS